MKPADPPLVALLVLALVCGLLAVSLATVALRGPAARCVCEARP